MAGAPTPRDHDETWLYNAIQRARKPSVTEEEVDEFCEDVQRKMANGIDWSTARTMAFEHLMTKRRT